MPRGKEPAVRPRPNSAKMAPNNSPDGKKSRSEVEAAARAQAQKVVQQGNQGLPRKPLETISNSVVGSATAIPSAVGGQAPTAAKPTAPRRVAAAPTVSASASLPASLLNLTVEEVNTASQVGTVAQERQKERRKKETMLVLH